MDRVASATTASSVVILFAVLELFTDEFARQEYELFRRACRGTLTGAKPLRRVSTKSGARGLPSNGWRGKFSFTGQYFKRRRKCVPTSTAISRVVCCAGLPPHTNEGKSP